MKNCVYIIVLILLISCGKENIKSPQTPLPEATNVQPSYKVDSTIKPSNIYLFDVYGLQNGLSNRSGFLFITEKDKPVRSVNAKKYLDTLNSFLNNQIRLLDCCDSNIVLREPKSIIFIVDVSGSMSFATNGVSGTRQEVVKQHIINFIRQHPLIEYAIIAFSDEGTIITEKYSSNIDFLSGIIERRIYPTRGTRYKSGLDLLKDFVKNNPRESHNVYFLSDGGDGDSGAKYLNYFKSFKRNKISLFSLIFNDKFMRNKKGFSDFPVLSDSLRYFYKDSVNGWFLDGIYPNKLADAFEVIFLINQGHMPCKVFWNADNNSPFVDNFRNSKHINYSLLSKATHKDIKDIYFPEKYENNYHFFTTGYYYPSTNEVLDNLEKSFQQQDIKKNHDSYIADPTHDIDPITGGFVDYRTHSEDIMNDLKRAHDSLIEFKTKLDSLGDVFDKLKITAYGYTDPRKIFPDAIYTGINDVSFNSVRINRYESFDNEKLAFLRGYFTYYVTVTQDFNVDSFRINLLQNDVFFRNTERFELNIRSMGNDAEYQPFALKRRASISLQLMKKADCPCYYQNK